MLWIAFFELVIALFILLWASKVEDDSFRQKIEFGVFMQFVLSVSIVLIYILR